MKYAKQQAMRVWVLLGMFLMMWAAGQQVTNTNDSGAGSLREAIANANNGDTITFAADLAGQTITLGSTLQNLFADNLTIDASGLANPVTIAGDNTFPILWHVGVGTFAINNLVVTGGHGGILSADNITVTNSTISNNTTILGGGGILSFGNVTVTNSTILGNTAKNLDSNGNGGGIFSSGNVTITNSTISGNTAEAEAGGIFSSGNITVINSTISDNTANFSGGGMYSGGNVTVINSTISANTTALTGGGIDSDGTVTVTNSTISGNTADSLGSGGGVHSFGLTLSGCTTIENNTANTGAQWNVTGTVTDGNNLRNDDYSGPDCSTPQTSKGDGLPFSNALFTVNTTAHAEITVNISSNVQSNVEVLE